MDLPISPELMKKFANNAAIITSKNNVMTCAWISRVSVDPPLISISIGKDRASYKIISKTKEFGACLCSDEQNVLASVAGGYSGKEIDKIKVLKELGVKFYDAEKINCLMIEDCCLNMECKVIKETEAGDHVIFIAKVLNAKSNDRNPILYSSGKYWKLGEQVMKPNAEMLEKMRMIAEKNRK